MIKFEKIIKKLAISWGCELPAGLQEYIEDKYPDQVENNSHPFANIFDTKILGWPCWVQDSGFPIDSVFIMYLNLYGLCEHASYLYIFQDIKSKEFHGFIQMT